MIGAGKTNQVDKTTKAALTLGHTYICRGKSSDAATRKCQALLKQTIEKATRGLSTYEKGLWMKVVYTPAVYFAGPVVFAAMKQLKLPAPKRGVTRCQQMFSLFSSVGIRLLNGTLKLKGFSGKQYTFSDYLIKGALMVKKMRLPGACKINPWN